MTSLRIGCDLCQIEPMRQLLTQGPGTMERLFLPEERAYALAQKEPEQHLAGIFAAKEALAKAVRSPELLGKYQREVTVGHGGDGAPFLRLSRELEVVLGRLGIRIVDLSLSHDGDYAVGVVLIEVAETSGDRRACARCLLSLEYLNEQCIADVLIKVEVMDGTTQYWCPVCVRGW